MLIHDAITEQRLSAKPNGTCTLKTPRPLTRKEASVLASVIAAFLKVMGSEVSGDGTGDMWYIVPWGEWAVDIDFKVTHWQPMPKPPEEVQG